MIYEEPKFLPGGDRYVLIEFAITETDQPFVLAALPIAVVTEVDVDAIEVDAFTGPRASAGRQRAVQQGGMKEQRQDRLWRDRWVRVVLLG